MTDENTGKRILVAEDEKPIANALTLKLEKEGYSVEQVSNGEELLEALGKQKYDLVLMDLIMPKKDGFTVLQELHEKGITVPIIVSSNLSQPEDAQRVKDLGAVDLLVKSNITLAEIVDKVKTFLK